MSRLYAIALLMVPLAQPAAADVLFISGPIDGTDTAFAFNDPFVLSASFTLPRHVSVNGFTFGGWTDAGTVISSLHYGISLVRDFNAPSVGTPTFGNLLVHSQQFNLDVREYTVSTAPVLLQAGTYYLTLAQAISPGTFTYWDVNNNIVSEMQFSVRDLNFGWQGPGVSFTIIGTSVPEPATWAMMIGGMGVVGGAMRRRQSSTKVTFA